MGYYFDGTTAADMLCYMFAQIGLGSTEHETYDTR